MLPTPEPGKITILNAVAPEALSSMTNGAVYFTLQNGTEQAIHLQRAEATIATRTSFHETVKKNGFVRMVPHAEGFAVAAGESLILAPGGKHLMLEQLQVPLVPGEEFALLLTFVDLGPTTVTVAVVNRDELQ